MGYNGGGMGKDDRDHVLYPQRKMLISEFSSGRGARGIYKREMVGLVKYETFGDGRIMPRSGQLTSIYDLCLSHEREWRHIAERPHLAGGCMWSGIEYIGETNGWPVVTSQFGVLDIARFKKDTYYYYLQEWTEKPMVHIFPHWNWKTGDTVKVWCYSNCDEAELFLNGRSLGKKPAVHLSHIEWQVPFEKGKLIVKGYRNGKTVADEEVSTAGKPAMLKAAADRKVINADGSDISFITVSVCDENGIMVPDASNMIEVKVDNGRLLGVCSGNPVAHDNPLSGKIQSFNGMLLAIVQSYDHPGRMELTASAPGIKSGNITVNYR
jgi:beta-galactosidase